MGKVTGSWERPIQGVSQQTDKDRFNGQCTLQENLVPSPLNGLEKRMGTTLVNQLLGRATSIYSKWYSYERGDGEAFLILIEDNELPRVFDLEGTERTVNLKAGDTGTPLGWLDDVNEDYIKVDRPIDKLRLSTVSDYTFITNIEQVTSIYDTYIPYNPNIAIIYCQYATYGRDYTIKVNGNVIATYLTKDGTEAEHQQDVRTNNVMTILAAQVNSEYVHINEELTIADDGAGEAELFVVCSSDVDTVFKVVNLSTGREAFGTTSSGNKITLNDIVNIGDIVEVTYSPTTGVPNPWEAELHDNVMYISNTTPVVDPEDALFTVETIDSSDGKDLVAIQGTVKQLAQLPPKAPEGYIVKVQNNEGYEANSFWLKAKYNAEDQTGSEMRWVESNAPATLYKLDKRYMPHVLISESDGSFTLSSGEWEDRKVGNDASNPFPSFVGKKISSIGSFQNRLLFTSGESAIFSRTNNFFDFFRETTQEVVSSDPIDVFADTDDVNNLKHNSTLDGDMVFFADNGQFLIKGDKPIDSTNLVFRKVTSYPMYNNIAPAVTGESIILPYIVGEYTGLREMFTDSLTDTKRARPLTEHVASYLKGRPLELISSPNINTLIVRTDYDYNTLYIYDWLLSGDQRVQSAFHSWKFKGSIQYAFFIQDKLYLSIIRSGVTFLEVIQMHNDEALPPLSFPIKLDQKLDTQATWTGTRWEWSYPYQQAGTDSLVFVRGKDCFSEDIGTSVSFETDDNINFWTFDDLADSSGEEGSPTTTCTLIGGSNYESKYIPTQPFIKDANGRVMGLDRFTISKVFLNYEVIGETSVIVRDIRTKREWSYSFNGRKIGTWNNLVGFAPLYEGSFQFPVRIEAKHLEFEILTTDYLPFTLRDMEWEGTFKQRGRRI